MSLSEVVPALLASIPITIVPSFMRGWFTSGPKYGRLPDSAMDDELDLGEDDEEAEELHDGDVYGLGSKTLNTLPVRSPAAEVPRLTRPPDSPVRASVEGSLLGEEFTSPHAEGKKG